MEMGEETQWKLFQKRGNWYAREVGGKRRMRSLETKEKEVAKINLQTHLGQEVLPENSRKHLELGRAHLNLVDPQLSKRTWGELMTHWVNGEQLAASTVERRERCMDKGVFPLLKDRLLCDLSVEPLISQHLPAMGTFAKKSLRHLQNHAIALGWILHPIVKPIHTKMNPKNKRVTRAITSEEHEAILERLDEGANNVWPMTVLKHGQERIDYYTCLFLTGAAQTDGANLKASNIDWKKKELVFHRQKTKERCSIAISGRLEKLLKSLPDRGRLFPNIAKMDQNKRAGDFRRIRIACDIEDGVSLHSYRYHMAEFCAIKGMPIRFAQMILGHASKTVALAYAKHCPMAAPNPETWGAAPQVDVIDGTALVA